MRSFVKIKPSQIGEITLSFTDIGKSRHFHEFLTSQICFNTICENKIIAKISEFTVSVFCQYQNEELLKSYHSASRSRGRCELSKLGNM